MIGNLEASFRFGKPARYRTVCDSCGYKGSWHLEASTARFERDQHNVRKHNVKPAKKLP